MFSPKVRIYPLTDVRQSGLSQAEQVSRLSDGGARLIQLREKHLTPREFYTQAREALIEARKRGVRIIINDRVDLALALGADGVHLGQDDLPPDAARRLLGSRAIVGLSTHTVEQALGAARLPVDYLAIGPIFTTLSKRNPDPALGLEGLRAVRRAVPNVKLVAIGGISHENATEVLDAGADAVAVIAALVAYPQEITDRTKRFIQLLDRPPAGGSTYFACV